MYKVVYFRRSGMEEKIFYSVDQAQRAGDAMNDLLYLRCFQVAAPKRRKIKEEKEY